MKAHGAAKYQLLCMYVATSVGSAAKGQNSANTHTVVWETEVRC